ncbi:dihydroxyacetone kinase phosphoryl donor subunit DhaM [Eubacteriaceae bacterium ES2]|nr:dihydroxyacetone kinase phosphoryl donor subunit DhaM [Eubacteriaceae bacterium ES2]
MTGVIIVSHSEKLAEGLRDIVMEMNDGSVEIIAAGGTGDGRIGTNTNRIKTAIETLQDKDQILIFVDLGSAVICSETAIEMLDDEALQDKVYIVDAPLVEGVVGGVVQATICDELDLIVATAKEGATIRKVN